MCFDFALRQPWPGSAERVEVVDKKRYQLLYGKQTVEMLIKTGEVL
jgi:hypothetical protein